MWLEELSQHTTPLPWGSGAELTSTLKILGADAEWVSMLSPAVAGPLASMLRFDAMRLKWANACEDVDKSYRGFELARLILGEPASREDSP